MTLTKEFVISSPNLSKNENAKMRKQLVTVFFKKDLCRLVKFVFG